MSKRMEKFNTLLENFNIRHTGRWFITSVIIGVVAGLGATIFFELLQLCSSFFLGTVAQYNPPQPAGEAIESALKINNPIRWLLVLIPTLGGLIAGLLVFSLAPETEGHGTDAVVESFHRFRGLIRTRVPFVKAVSSIITIGTGGSAGREGPIAQIGAGFGSFLADRLKLPDSERRVLMVSGMAGGIGSIFRSPLGGAIFSVEVLYKRDFEASALIQSLISSIVAYSVFTARFGWGTLFRTPDYIFNNPIELVFYLLLGLVCVAVGILYIRIFYGLRDSFFHKIKIPPHVKPALGGFLLGLIALFVPQVLASGYGYLQQAIDGELAIKYMLLFAAAKIIGTSFTISSGGSGGVFAPSLFIGGMLGGAFGHAVDQIFPNTINDPSAFVLVGMGAFFAGVAKTPISSMIMVCEMTGGYFLLVPMIAASAVSYLFTGRFSIYEKQVDKMSDSPAHLGDFTLNVLDEMTVEHAYKPMKSVAVVPESMMLPDFRRVISRQEISYFPVVDEHKKIVGIISMRSVHSILFEDQLDQALIAKDLMMPVVLVTANENLHSALLKFISSEHGVLPVVDEQDETKIIGLLSHEGLIAAYNKEIMQRKFGDSNHHHKLFGRKK